MMMKKPAAVVTKPTIMQPKKTAVVSSVTKGGIAFQKTSGTKPYKVPYLMEDRKKGY